MTKPLVLLNRFCGVGALALGVAFWLGYARALTPLHMWLGIGVVVSLWGLAVRALLTGGARGLATGGLIWGAVVWMLGMSQTRLLPGSSHWIIQVAHLIAGGIAIGLAGRVAQSTAHAAPVGETVTQDAHD